MQISWNGLSCFELKAKTAVGEATLVLDPYENSTGLRFPRSLEADMVAVSHDQPHANNVAGVQGNPFVISTPGEYEVKGIFVYGIKANRKQGEKKDKHNMIFRIEAEQMSLAHLGALDRELTNAELEQLENVDILIIPVGGGRVMDPKTASTVISQVEPRVVIPMNHAIPNVKEKAGTIEDFCKELGTCRREDASKLKIAKKDLPEEDMLMVTLSR
jgi:L-ascorbate metabolism protein UlaG (beta-lactamase superfamily)